MIERLIKNIAMAGGFLLLACTGPGRLRVDGERARGQDVGGRSPPPRNYCGRGASRWTDGAGLGAGVS